MNIKLDPVIKKILIERGIDTPERVAEFFSPVPKSTYDPFLYKNMDAVCDRIIKSGSVSMEITTPTGLPRSPSLWRYWAA